MNEVTPKVTPRFEDVRGQVETSWQAEAQRSANQAALKTLIQKYKVDVQDADENNIAE